MNGMIVFPSRINKPMKIAPAHAPGISGMMMQINKKGIASIRVILRQVSWRLRSVIPPRTGCSRAAMIPKVAVTVPMPPLERPRP